VPHDAIPPGWEAGASMPMVSRAPRPAWSRRGARPARQALGPAATAAARGQAAILPGQGPADPLMTGGKGQ
jgi:hypothetical protein